jgi:hypothetical protein
MRKQNMPQRTVAPSPPGATRYAPRFLKLKQQLQQLEYFCKGTVLHRRMKCGQPACACHTNAARRHGPYWEWTYKAHGKTVNVRLPPAAGPIFRKAARQYRQLKSLLARLERLSRTALQAMAKAGASPHNRTPGGLRDAEQHPRPRRFSKSMRH